MDRRILRFAAFFGLLGLLSTWATAAHAQVLRFSGTHPGNVVATGNTLGLSKQVGLNGPGTADAIGTFITLDTTSADDMPPNPGNPWPAGTTADWTANGSAATLVLPAEATVLHAELVWGGSHLYVEDVSGALDAPVTLSTGADTMAVMPDPATAVTIDQMGSFDIHYYMRSADVTAFVAQQLGTTYTVEGVPATQHELANTTHAAGWTLVVAYRFDGEPIRNLSVFVGGEFVDENTSVDYEVDGFCAPPTPPFEGAIVISTIEGDANRVGDGIAIGDAPNDMTFIPLSGPNNPVDNFFCSQINGPNGALDTSGTFGASNHLTTDANPDPLLNTNNQSGARQGWDVAHVGLSSDDGHLLPDQTQAVLRTQTESDSYMPVLAALAIDVNAPKFLYDQSTTSVDKTSVTVGDTFAVTARLVNEGTAPADNVRFTMALPAGISLTAFTTNGAPGDVGGGMVTQAMLTSGVDMGDLLPGDQREVVLTLEVTQSLSADILVQPVWFYEYVMCSGDPAIMEQFAGQVQGVDYTGDGGAGGAGGSSGSAAGGAGGAGLEDFGAYTRGGGFCNCEAAGGGAQGGAAPLALLGFALALRRRRSPRAA